MVSPFEELVNQNGKKYAQAIKNSKKDSPYSKCRGCPYVSMNCPNNCAKEKPHKKRGAT